MPCCDETTHTCAGASETAMFCYTMCSMATCTAGGAAGVCREAGEGIGFCQPDTLPSESTCEAGTECADNPAGGGGLCMSFSDGGTYCFDMCTPEPSGCDMSHECVPVTGADFGVCVAAA